MTVVIAPDRVLHHIRNEPDLKALVLLWEPVDEKRRNALAGNLRQLLGWTLSGTLAQPRPRRKEADNFQQLADVRCLQHTSGEVVVCVGKPAYIWQNIVSTHPSIHLAMRTVRDVLNGSNKNKPGGWELRKPPDWWMRLPSGTHLVGLGEQPAAAQVNHLRSR
jgi:hypothetical protein